MRIKGFMRAGFIVCVNVVFVAVLLEGGAFPAYWLFVHDAENDLRPRERLLAGAGGAAGANFPGRAVSSEFDPNTVLHPYLGYVRMPRAASADIQDTEFGVSRFGFLGDHSRLERSDDEVIVAISGGSVATVFFKRGTEALRGHLERSPSFAGKKIRFVSFSLAGFKQPQALMALNYFLVLGAEFDVWINLDGFNEIVLPIAENLPAQVALEYPRMWHLYARKTPDREVLLKMAEVEALQRERSALRRLFARPALSHSRFFLLVWDLLDRAKRSEVSELSQAINELLFESPPSPQTSGPAFDRAPGLEGEALMEAAQLWKRSSVQMAHLCAANGIEYYHFLQPNQHYEGSKPFSLHEKDFAVARGGYARFARKGYPVLVAAGASLLESDVPFYDLTGIFAKETRTVYIDSCCHVNQLGNDLLAEAIADAIVERREHLQELEFARSTP